MADQQAIVDGLILIIEQRLTELEQERARQISKMQKKARKGKSCNGVIDLYDFTSRYRQAVGVARQYLPALQIEGFSDRYLEIMGHN